MKVIVLENGIHLDMPERLKRYLSKNNIDWELYNMIARFWPENRKETVEYFSNLPKNQEFIIETVFHEFQQLELMIELLYKLKEKEFTIKILHPCLCDNLTKWLKAKESEITPKELEAPFYDMSREYSDKELDEAQEKVYQFKRDLVSKFQVCLEKHNLIWIDRFDGDLPIKNIKTIEENVFDY